MVCLPRAFISFSLSIYKSDLNGSVCSVILVMDLGKWKVANCFVFGPLPGPSWLWITLAWLIEEGQLLSNSLNQWPTVPISKRVMLTAAKSIL